MGLLEARGLDPRHIILLGAQEGKLPTASIERSYIPFELRRAYGLPLRDSSDAVMPATLSMRAIMSPPNIASFRAMSMFRTISREINMG